MARNRQTAWRVEGYRQEIRDHGGLLAETRGQEGTAFPDRRVFRHGGFVAVRGRAHAPQAAPYRQTRVRQARRGGGLRGLVLVGAALREEVARGASVRRRRLSRARLERRRLYFVKLRWTCSALNLNTVGVQLEHRRRLVPCFVVCLVYLMRECLFR